MAELGTRLAHIDGGVPNILITIPTLEEKYLGQLIYFFEKACGISGYILDVNPFNQPGVEAYKRNRSNQSTHIIRTEKLKNTFINYITERTADMAVRSVIYFIRKIPFIKHPFNSRLYPQSKIPVRYTQSQ